MRGVSLGRGKSPSKSCPVHWNGSTCPGLEATRCRRLSHNAPRQKPIGSAPWNPIFRVPRLPPSHRYGRKGVSAASGEWVSRQPRHARHYLYEFCTSLIRRRRAHSAASLTRSTRLSVNPSGAWLLQGPRQDQTERMRPPVEGKQRRGYTNKVVFYWQVSLLQRLLLA